MFISRIELIGFKSFASRTTLEFRPGVMAVVGPNGCGKSNIVDAVRWVLGEQKTGMLRAERMEAVIFNGTSRRRPLGMAEVTMTIENDKGILPTTYSEVAITRRLFRSGESEYLINRNPARLRDINDMFIDTGFGSNAYSIIELTMVEGIIAGPALARRQLFEEAAGISRYKARRHSAQRRLDTTRDNLLRIDDIYNEIVKTYNSLKRQASKARRYQALSRGFKLRLTADLAEQRLDIISRRKPLEDRLTEIETECAQAEHDLTSLTSELLSFEGRELNLIDRANRTQDALKRIDRREAELEGESALIKQRIAFLESELSQTDNRRKELMAKGDQSQQHREAALSEIDKLASQLKELADKRQSLQKSLSDLEKKIADSQKLADEARTVESEARRKLTQFQDRGEEAKKRHKRAVERLDFARHDLARLDKRSSEIEKELNKLSEAGLKSGKIIKRLMEKLSVTKDRFETAREKHSASLTRQAGLAANREAAKSALESHRSQPINLSTQPKTLRKLITSEKLRTIATRLESKPEHQQALASVLGPILDVIDRPDFESVITLIRGIEKWRQASLRFPVDRAEPPALAELPPKSKGCILGPRLVENEDDLGDFIRRRLDDVILVPDLDVMISYAGWARSRKVRLVTLNGELLEPDGVIHAGSLNPESVRVGWASTLHDLESTFKQAATEEEKSALEVDKCVRKLRTAEKDYQLAREEFEKNQDRAVVDKRNHAALTDEHASLKRRLNDLTSEITSLEEMTGFEPEVVDKDYAKSLEKAIDVAVKKRQTCEKALHELEQNRQDSSKKSAIIHAETVGIEAQNKSLKQDVERLASESRQVHNSLAALEADIKQKLVEQERVKQSAGNITGQMELNQHEKKDIDQTLQTVKSERAEVRKAREDATEALNKAQKQQKTGYQERSRIEGEAIALREQLREVDRRLVEDAEFQPLAVVETTIQDALVELEELDLAEMPMEKLRLRLQSLGAVNMLAIDELEEIESRYRFLADQRKDLQQGIEVLEETIEHINFEARRLFRETFDKVNVYFQETFRELFEGGEARIALDNGDPLEADIKIWATPVGKKLQNLTMLSGGEKAMTAVALLFSIYRARPTPFCILDEVDAPLDEANVTRFNRMLHRYTKDTQFLIITHNKRTMETSNCLYGVTLGEDGTSRLVSVEIEKSGGEPKEEKQPKSAGVSA